MSKTTKRWIIFIITAIALFIIANAINILIVQQEPEIPITSFVQTNANNTQSSFSNISYVGPTPSFPQSLPIASAQSFTTSEEDIVTIIVDQFNLSPFPDVPDLWTNSSWAFSKNGTDFYTLVQNQFLPVEVSGMTTEATIRTADNFVNNYFQQLQLSTIESNIIFYEDSLEHDEPGSAENAQVAKIPFSYTIENYPVFYEQKSIFPFEVWVNAENQVIKFTYFPQFIQLREIGNKPLISIDQAIENINQQNLGSVISFFNNSFDVVGIEEIDNADLDTVQLEYRVDSSTNLAFPFYRFSGTTLLSGIETEIEITTPAVVVE